MQFKFDGLVVDSEIEPWRSEGIRVGFYSAPGTRKSYTVAACVVEPFLEEGGTVVIFQPRSEWHTLKEKWGSVVVVGGPFQDVSIATNQARVYAEAIVNDGVSMVFDFSETEEEDLVRFAAELLARMFTLQNVVRRPLLLFIEEGSNYCPFSSRGKVVPPWVYERMVARITKIATQGRPLGFVLTITSQRPAQLNFTVRMMCNISFYGKFHPKDLNDIKEVLSAYKVAAKEMAEKCVNMPHGSWITITSEGATFTTIKAKRLTSHGADTPKLEYIAPQTEETKKTVTDLVDTIQKALQQERLEESEVAKLKKEVTDLKDIIAKQKEHINKVESALTIASKLEIKAPEVKGVNQEEFDKVKAQLASTEKRVKDFLQGLKIEVIETFDREVNHFTGEEEVSQVSTVLGATDDTFEMWLHKLPSPCSKKVFTFLTKHKGMKFTRSQLALQTGYTSSGGAFGATLSLLRRNNLIKNDGDLWWAE